MYDCYLTCPRGLERQAQIDLEHFLTSSIIDKGGIKFNADQSTLYNINLHSRIGMHLLVKLFDFNASDENILYKEVYNFLWDKIISSKQTFIIKVKGKSKIFPNTNYLTLKIKDAIVDKIKKIKYSRPSINKDNPDVIISVFINKDKITIYRDSSGISLHKRGYRNKIHRAMLNESLAAGLIMLSNWNKLDPFYDLMCGSGTLPIEAALMAHNIAPGLLRESFGFQKWLDYDSKLFSRLKKKATSNIQINSNVKIYGFDIAFQNIAISLSSIKSINLSNVVKFKKQDIKNFIPYEKNGIIMINPPYGERLKQSMDELENLYEIIGDIFKNKCIGFNGYIFTSNLEAVKFIGLKSKIRIPLKNGKLDCRLLHYPIKKGEYK
jgi:putative N6-adenine-specific DNA methylase